MTDDTKFTIEKFNGTDFAYWKMQIEDLLYQKNLYLPLGGKAKKPATMSDAEWEVLDRKALATVRLSLSKSVTFNISKENTTKDVMDALSRMYEKPSATNKVFLIRKLFNMKMVEGGVVAEHLNKFNTVMSQLSSVNIQFEDEIWALLVLSSLPDSWNDMVTSLSNSSGSTKLKFGDVVSAIQSLTSTSFTSTTSSVFGLNSSPYASTLNSSSSANHSQNYTPFVATCGSLFSTQVAPAVSSFPAFTQTVPSLFGSTVPSLFGSSASASLFGSGSSFGSDGSSPFVSTSSFGSTTDGAKLFGSGTVFRLSSSSSFCTGSSSFSSSSSSFTPSGVTSLFGSGSQPAASSMGFLLHLPCSLHHLQLQSH